MNRTLTGGAKIAGLLLSALGLLPMLSAFAFETDQYNLPPAPLADIGDEVTAYALENIREALAGLNAEIAAREACLASGAKKSGCRSSAKERARLTELRSAETLARAVFKPLGGGIPPFTNAGTWMESHRFKAQPARYKTSFGKSIYRTSPVLYLTISETVRIYGVELGTDKIAHIFQQGYTYHRLVERAEAKRASPEAAVRQAVEWGRATEKTYYGYWVSGVYSNADLAANYAGMKFYRNLTREITIGGRVLPPLLVLKNGFWALNESLDLRENLVRPFVSNHLNEALNPSVYVSLFGFRGSVRRAVEKHACPQWRKLYPDRQRLAAAFSADLRLWHGEDYGFKASRDPITLAAACFDDGDK